MKERASIEIPNDLLRAFELRDVSVFDRVNEHLLEWEDRAEPRDWVPMIRLREALVFCGLEYFSPREEKNQEAAQTLVLKCNSYAMSYLELEHYPLALELLTIADQHTTASGYIHDANTRSKLRAVTLNNLGCYYKKTKKIYTAIQCLDEALKIEASTTGCDNPAGTHLNICAILSELKRHRAAADHAKCAIQLLKCQKTLESASREETETTSRETSSLLGIAYFNWGVELEHLLHDGALEAYKCARRTLLDESGTSHPLLPTIEQAIVQASAHKIKKRREKKTRVPCSPRRPLSPMSIRKQERVSNKLESI